MKKDKFLSQMIHDAINCLSPSFFLLDENDETLHYIKQAVEVLRTYEAIFENNVTTTLIKKIIKIWQVPLELNENYSVDALSFILYLILTKQQFSVDFISFDSFLVHHIDLSKLNKNHGLAIFFKENYTYKIVDNKILNIKRS